MSHIARAREVFAIELAALKAVGAALDASFDRAVGVRLERTPLTRLIKRTVYGDISSEEALRNLEEIARNRRPQSGAPPVPAPARPAPTP